MDGHRVEFGFAAKLPADNFLFRQIFNKNSKYKIYKTNKFKTYMLEAN